MLNVSYLVGSDDVFKIFLLVCESRNNKLSIMGLVGIDKLIVYSVVFLLVFLFILVMLKDVSNFFVGYILCIFLYCF